MKCCKCMIDFDDSFFYNDKSKPSGKKPRCKSCEKLYINKEKRMEYEKSYWDKRRDRKREIVRVSHQKKCRTPQRSKKGVSKD